MSWSIGSALRTTLRVSRTNFVTFYPATLVCCLPWLVIDLFALHGMLEGAASLITYVFASTTLTYGVIRALHGERPGFGVLLQQLKRTATSKLVWLCIIQSIAISVGLLLLIIPGLFLLVAWTAATPAMIVERTKIGESFNRSMELTRDRRWRILGAYAALLVLLLVTILPALFVVFLLFGEGDVRGTILVWLLTSLFTYAITALSPVLYVMLRCEKAGATIQDIVADLDRSNA
jgi:hypothetical protein